jgi:hypothetical protein
MPTIPQSQFTPGMPISSNLLNNAIDRLIQAIEGHTHNPIDASAGYGAALDPYSPSIRASGTEPVSKPTDNSGSYSGINTVQSGHGEELSRVRYQIASLTGGNWYDPVGKAVAFDPGTENLGIAGDYTAQGQFISRTTDLPPFQISSSLLVQNLNADRLHDYLPVSTDASQTHTSFVSAIPVMNSSGYLPPTLVQYDSVEAATNDNLTTNASDNTVINSLNRIRYQLQQINAAAGGTSWNTPPTSITTSVSIDGGTRYGGDITFINGAGVIVSEVGPGSYRFDATSVAAFTPGSLVYADFFPDTVLTGLTVTTDATTPNIIISPGIAYVAGGKRGLIYPMTLTPSLVSPHNIQTGQTNWIFWNGTPSTDGFVVLTGSSRPATPASTIPVAKVVIDSTPVVTSIVDIRPIDNLLGNQIDPYVELQNIGIGYTPSSTSQTETVVFNPNGTISSSYLGGLTSVMTFNPDGTITEDFTSGPLSTAHRSKTTSISGTTITTSYS